MNSLVTRGIDNVQSFASPLAQVFQPLIVDDDIPEETVLSASPPSQGISYGPASRRRLSSMASMHKRETLAPPSHGIGMRRFPTLSPTESSSGAPEQRSNSGPRLTAEGIRRIEETEGGQNDMALVGRLQSLEDRQTRMEALLTQIANDLKQLKQ